MTAQHPLLRRIAAIISIIFIVLSLAPAQFIDHFKDRALALDPTGANGWTYFIGDGSATMTFSASRMGYASIIVDATKDKRGIWRAIIKRRVSEHVDLNLLRKGHCAFRVEARVRVSDAPKRVNLSLNTQRTTDFHTHLMGFEIPDMTNWHTVSMTTHRFDAVPGDSVYGQLALMDWGLDRYRVDIDYFRVDIVNPDTTGKDLGTQAPYHPAIPSVDSFKYHLHVAQDCTIDLGYPDMNFNNWSSQDSTKKTNLLPASENQFVILRWDFHGYSRVPPVGS